MSQWDDPTREYGNGDHGAPASRDDWAVPGAPTPGTSPGTSADPGASTGEDGPAGFGGAGSNGDRARPGAPGSAAATSPPPADPYRRIGPTGAPELWPGPIPLRPLGFGEIIETAFRVLRFNPRALFGLSFVILGIAVVLGVLAGAALTTFLGLGGSDTFPGETTLNFGSYASSAAASILSGLLVVPIAEAALGRRLTAGQTWRRAKGRIPALIGYALLTGLLMLLLLSPIIVVFLYGALTESTGVLLAALAIAPFSFLAWAALAVALTPAPAAIVLEGAGPIQAIRRAFHLVRGGYWRAVGVMIVTTLVVQIALSLLLVPVFALAAFALASTGGLDLTGPAAAPVLVGIAVVLTLVSTVVQPVTSAVAAMIYLDRRFRTEALAVDLLAEAERAARG